MQRSIRRCAHTGRPLGPVEPLERFDVLVGNPPWLSHRYVERGAYQEFLKREITEHYQLLASQPENLSNMELATLFLVRATDLYLRDGGAIGFVLPKSIFAADQHHAFRQGNYAARVRLREAWDLEGVRPLFNVPASVAFAEKSPQETEWPLAGRAISGELGVRNASPSEAAEHLIEASTQYWLSLKGTRSYLSEKREKATTEGSRYREKFARGADMIPRSFWFAAVQQTPGLGYDSARPYVSTDPRAAKAAKPQYRDVRIEGNVESEFLYWTLLSTDLVPFGHLPFRTVVLPILSKPDGYKMLTAHEAREEGYLGLAAWMEKCERIWKEKRGDKADRETIYSWLDYRKKLTQQQRKKCTVLYPDVNRVMFGSIVHNPGAAGTPSSGTKPRPALVVETTTYSFDADASEAQYLLCFLNSTVLDSMLQPFRRKAQAGHPHVHKKIWEFPIPTYDPSDSAHKDLAALGAECTRTREAFLCGLPPKIKEGSLGRLRSLIRDHLKERISEIDSIVKGILQ